MAAHQELLIEIATACGPGRALCHVPARPVAVAALGHGAGGGPDSADLVAVAVALSEAGFAVARVEQPYRVAGRRAPPRAPVLDSAFVEIVAALCARWPGVPLVTGGRSMGARVACRTAGGLGASAVLALAFPLHPPGRPERSRADELVSAGPPVVVLQGERDPFGTPGELPAVACLLTVAGAGHELSGVRADTLARAVGFIRERVSSA